VSLIVTGKTASTQQSALGIQPATIFVGPAEHEIQGETFQVFLG
jgi:hypothetical protein